MRILIVATLVLAGVTAGCGSSSCGEGVACGGDIVGTWTISRYCAYSTRASGSMSCPQAMTTVANPKASGTLTFTSDLGYASNVTLDAMLDATLPSSCLNVQGQTYTCDDVMHIYQQPGSPFTSASCKPDAVGSCACVFGLAATTTNQTGTYALSGTNVALSPTDSAPTSPGYCVKGSQLEIMGIDMGMGTAHVLLTR